MSTITYKCSIYLGAIRSEDSSADESGCNQPDTNVVTETGQITEPAPAPAPESETKPDSAAQTQAEPKAESVAEVEVETETEVPTRNESSKDEEAK